MSRFFLLCLVCTLATAFSATASFHQLGYEYLYPRPDAEQVSPHATIILRFNDLLPGDFPSVQEIVRVYGENGSELAGSVKVASDKKTILFRPDFPYTPGERIQVKIAPNSDLISSMDYSFRIAPDERRVKISDSAQPSLKKPVATMGEPQIMPNGVSVPSDFPYVDVFVNDNPADGYIFINNWGSTNYNVLFEPDGSPFWYQKYPDERRDMKVQKNGLVTMLVRQGYSFGQGFVGLDNSYTEVATYHAVDGYSTDEHELQVLENGHYLLVGIRGMTVDMTKIVPGGQKNARISESGIQEFTPDGDLIFQWSAWDNFHPKDMIGFSDDQPTNPSFRFPHFNSIDIDDDGHIILSSKRLSEVTKIHRQTGEKIWRLGGANNQFTFVDDPLNGFSMQHSARVLGNGHYTIFDNGVFHNPPVSRAIEYKLDTKNKTATLVWSYTRKKPPVYAYHMGNAQRLPNGNTFINWAVENMPKAEEVRPDGTVAYEMNYVDRFKTYRAFKFPWQGIAATPNLIVESRTDNLTLLFNKFGDINVDYYNIYAGTSPHPKTVIATSKQTLLKLYDLVPDEYYYFRVTAVGKDGTESGYSNEERVLVKMTGSGEMAVNGDFSDGKNSWDWQVNGDASASWSVADNTANISISKGGTDYRDIQLAQSGIVLIQGRHYTFEFSAWADNPRPFEAVVAQNSEQATNYGRIGLTGLTGTRRHYAYDFTMQDPSDTDARIVFNMGTNTDDVHIKAVSIKMTAPTDVDNQALKTPFFLSIDGNYPNPFNPETKIQYSVGEQGHITLKIFNLLGHEVFTPVDESKEPGNYHVVWNGLDGNGQAVGSGVYFCRLTNGREERFHKMLLVR
ncbi:aryl-sulfate sulfotransferase [candidate division KSB1 bacterium]|nr:aryl-sulfate sulfotransferase [candidate division KSB1 bacterium]